MTKDHKENLEVVIITGMSGAGKSVAVRSFEDIGYFCVDNLPPELLGKFFELVKESDSVLNKVALVIDLRGRDFFTNLLKALDETDKILNVKPKVLFLDADDETIIRRYKETRRAHPLAAPGQLLEGVVLERGLLKEIKGRSELIIDTTNLKPRELRSKIIENFAEGKMDIFTVNFMSFGFKHGIPIDADLVFDVRFLPNPFYIEEMRPKTGKDPLVANYVLKWPETKQFLEKLIDLLTFMLPQYIKEGKSQLVVAIGCTGGQHRSVALSEYLGGHFEERYFVKTNHRDLSKREG